MQVNKNYVILYKFERLALGVYFIDVLLYSSSILHLHIPAHIKVDLPLAHCLKKPQDLRIFIVVFFPAFIHFMTHFKTITHTNTYRSQIANGPYYTYNTNMFLHLFIVNNKFQIFSLNINILKLIFCLC